MKNDNKNSYSFNSFFDEYGLALISALCAFILIIYLSFKLAKKIEFMQEDKKYQQGLIKGEEKWMYEVKLDLVRNGIKRSKISFTRQGYLNGASLYTVHVFDKRFDRKDIWNILEKYDVLIYDDNKCLIKEKSHQLFLDTLE